MILFGVASIRVIGQYMYLPMMPSKVALVVQPYIGLWGKGNFCQDQINCWSKNCKYRPVPSDNKSQKTGNT